MVVPDPAIGVLLQLIEDALQLLLLLGMHLLERGGVLLPLAQHRLLVVLVDRPKELDAISMGIWVKDKK